MDKRLTLLLNPVRMRLVHAMRVGVQLTTGDLCARLPDLPKATIYRHVERLLRGGVFEVAGERRVRGAVERSYRLVPSAAGVSAKAARTMTTEDHRRTFTAATATLMADFEAYLETADADPTRDEVSYRQFVVWLSPAERSRLIAELARSLRPILANKASGRRAPYTLSTIFFPAGRRE